MRVSTSFTPVWYEATVNGPVPTALVARESTASGENMAPSGPASQNGTVASGLVSTTLASVGETTSTWSSAARLPGVFAFHVLTRSRENFTAAASNGDPLLNFTPSRSVKS